MKSFQFNNGVVIPTGIKISGNCPFCKRDVTFDSPQVKNAFDYQFNPGIYCGSRICPNQNCRKHVFFILGNNELTLFPAQTIQYDNSNLPELVRKHFDEAIICHSEQCYSAAAMMIRRTLEDICHDKESEGANLFNRIENLKSKVVLPPALFTGMHHLRLLGNDAAHIEAQDYNIVGKDEVSLGIELTKQILHAVYQFDDLVSQLEKLQTT